MTWFTKAKEWWKGLFKKEESVSVVVKEIPVTAVAIEAPKKEESELSKKAKEVRALGLSDLIKPVSKVAPECDHNLTFKKQTWTRVSDKKFELQNEMACTKCASRKVLPIG